jgi:arginyl-tRNA synthetase
MFKEKIGELLGKRLELKKEEIIKLLEKPKPEFGDYAFPCFGIAMKLKENPFKLAQFIASTTKLPKEIEKIEAKGAYVNFFINKKILAENVLNEILKNKEKFGSGNNKEKIMIEFSQANTHKAFHIGHVRGTSLGESLARLLEFSGNKVIRANYQGDTGMHVAKWIWCYQKYHSKEELKKEESWIAKIYVDAVKKLAENEKLQEEVNEINRKLEEGKDKKLMELWKKTRQLSLDSLETIYRELDTKFNAYFFEGNMEKPGKDIVKELLKKGIAEVSAGATIANLENYNLGVWVLLRSDGTVLYSAKDIALAEMKYKKFKLDKSIIVVGAAQTLHMNQLKKILEISGFKHYNGYSFIPYAEVRLPSGKMSSRTGENILYSEFMEEVVDYAKHEIKKRFPELKKEEIEKRALAISIAAVKYSMLKQDANKNIVFSKEEELNFEGDTGPYLLYSYARASSIIRKAEKTVRSAKITSADEKEILLIKKLSEFPEVADNASKNTNPAAMANYSLQLCQIFNEFYHACPVINAEPEIKSARLAMVEAFRIVIKQSLNLLGIKVINEM